MHANLRAIKQIIWGYVIEDAPKHLQFYLEFEGLHRQVRKYLDDTLAYADINPRWIKR
jgi:hypothetical protein